MGLNGINMALQVFKDYYAKGDEAHSSFDGASSGIIGLLEVCESDFSRNFTEMKGAEESAISTCEPDTKLLVRGVQDLGGCQLGQFCC